MPSTDTLPPMLPVEQAAAVYEQEPCARSFREDLEAHFLNGYVISTPEYFVMGRAVRRDWPREDILNPFHISTDPRLPDCWMVWLAAGSILGAFHQMPYNLPWIAFERDNVLRFWPTEKFRRSLWKSSALRAAVCRTLQSRPLPPASVTPPPPPAPSGGGAGASLAP